VREVSAARVHGEGRDDSQREGVGDITGDDVTRQGDNVIGKKEENNDIVDVAEMRGDKDVHFRMREIT